MATRKLRILWAVETDAVTVLGVRITEGRKCDEYRVRVRDDGFHSFEWSHADEPTRFYKVGCLRGWQPSTCTCPCARWTPSKVCRHRAASEALVSIGVIGTTVGG